MKKNQQQKVGGAQPLDDQTEALRLDVVNLELKSRYWRAQFELMDYTLKVDEVQGKYNDFLKKRQEQMIADYEAQVKEQENLSREDVSLNNVESPEATPMSEALQEAEV